jgi:hypothetical protein
MKTPEQTNLTTYSNPSYLSSEQGGLLFLIQDGELRGSDLGHQGGGRTEWFKR